MKGNRSRPETSEHEDDDEVVEFNEDQADGIDQLNSEEANSPVQTLENKNNINSFDKVIFNNKLKER